MANIGDQVDIEVTIQGGAIIEHWRGKVASVKGDKIEVEISAATGRAAKLPVTKGQLRPSETAGQWSLTVQVKLPSP